MITRVRKAMEEREEGFTLIELLVVIIIIGILAAIAIPVFLNQRKKAWDAAVKSDLRNAATAEETWLTDNNAYTTSVTNLETDGFKFSAAGNYSGGTQAMTILLDGTSTGYCLSATSNSGTTWYYDNEAGGLQPNGTTACPAATGGSWS
jgi:type IV pilus assembly protein PilA